MEISKTTAFRKILPQAKLWDLQTVPEAGQLSGEQALQGHTSNPGSTGWDLTGTGSLPQVITQLRIRQ